MLKQFDFTKMPITDVVNEIIYNAAQAGASDIHFDPSETTMKVRFRIDGILIDYLIVPLDVKKNLVARIKILSGMAPVIQDNVAMLVGMGLFVILNYFGQRFLIFNKKED